jgi:hypothetical protein
MFNDGGQGVAPLEVNKADEFSQILKFQNPDSG